MRFPASKDTIDRVAPRYTGVGLRFRNGRLRAWCAAAALAAVTCLPLAARAQAPYVDLGIPFWNFVSSSGIMTELQGENAWVSAASGYPAVLGMVDPATGAVLATATLPGAHDVWGYARAPSGTIYMGTSPGAALFSYVPGGTPVDLGSPDAAAGEIWCLTYDTADQTLYGGLGTNGALFSYVPATHTFHDLGTLVPHHAFVRSVAAYGDEVYAGLGGPGGLVAYDVQTGTVSQVLPPSETNAESVNALQVVRGLLFAHLTNGIERVVNLATGRLVATIGGVNSPGVSPETDGDHVGYTAQGGVWLWNLRTHTAKEISLNLPAFERSYLSTVGADAVAMVQENTASLSGWAVAGLASKGTYWILGTTQGVLESGPVAIHASVGTIESLAAGPDGYVFASSYLSGSTYIYDTATGQGAVYLGPGQAEDMTADGPDLVLGVYPSATLWRYDPSKPWNWGPFARGTENPAPIGAVGDDQDRPMALVVGPDGTLYVGTVPVPGALGGALTTVSPSGQMHVLRNLIPGESPISLTWADGLLVGGTTISGGIGAHPDQTSGQLFVWNPATGTLVATLTPFPGTPAIAGLTTGPNGTVYGLTHTHIFAYDPQDNTLIASAPLPWTAGTGYGAFTWGANTSLHLGPDGNLYGSVDGRAFVANRHTLAVTTILPSGIHQVVVTASGEIFAIGNAGTHLYQILFPATASPSS